VVIVSVLLAALPVLAVVGMLLAGRSAVASSLAGLLTALVVGVTAFPVPAALAPELLGFLPLLAEIAAILLTGVVLARLLTASGAMHRISGWVLETAPGPVAGAVLVVFGVVPFVESVTGFGIGLTIGVPVLVHLGYGVRRAAVLGILGMVAACWGGLAVGVRVGGGLTDMPLSALGVAAAVFAAGPVLVAVVATAAVLRSWGAGLLYGLLGGGVMLGATGLFNALVGPALSWVLGSLVALAALLAVFRLRGSRLRADRALRLSLLPYGVVTAGLLAASALAAVLPHTLTHALTSPPLWLAAGCLTAAVLLHRRGPGTGAAIRAGVRQWVPVGVATASFMSMGWVLMEFGMSAALGQALSVLGPWTVPVLGALGTVLAGSITGAQSMFATTFVQVAEATAVSPLTLLAASLAACGLANGASPARAALAVSLAESALPEPRRAAAGEAGHERAVLLIALGLSLLSAGVIAVHLLLVV
jgi:lactate permease